MRKITTRVDDDLFRRVRVKSVDVDVPVNEVVTRLLRFWVDGKINVARREVMESVVTAAQSPVVEERLERAREVVAGAPRASAAEGPLFARAGCPNKVPEGVRCPTCSAVHKP